MTTPEDSPQKGLKARQSKADALAVDVKKLAGQYASMGRNMPARVADELGISVRLVREILDAGEPED
ncbi:MAG TPA: hypothetical protein VKM35_12000 [Arenimonas sp.]|uniref:hypothetical protein n=1 Tax=Arenimonas sp. TaxID=1872635 RepID=UPI002C2D1777|nr:hypothetical protein [Arenimonas sp.]HMB57913.1 hypothetical protein [Arenimonas sp.]